MANISAQDVMKLREISGGKMMDCKKALVECDGDMDKAMDYLREKSLIAGQKKASRIAAEGIVDAYITDDTKVGVLVEVNCETDFVAKTDGFKELVRNIAKHIAKKQPKCVDCLLEQPYAEDESKTVSALINEAVAKMGEKIAIRRFAIYNAGANGSVGSYIHMNGTIGVMIEINSEAGTDNADFLAMVHDIAMHIAAAKPAYVGIDAVDASAIEKEKEIFRAQALNEGKPEKIVEKMVEGRIRKFYEEVCLVEQAFVKNPDVRIKQVVADMAAKLGGAMEVVRFELFVMGEGLEKRQDNFAEEVQSQMGK